METSSEVAESGGSSGNTTWHWNSPLAVGTMHEWYVRWEGGGWPTSKGGYLASLMYLQGKMCTGWQGKGVSENPNNCENILYWRLPRPEVKSNLHRAGRTICGNFGKPRSERATLTRENCQRCQVNGDGVHCLAFWKMIQFNVTVGDFRGWKSWLWCSKLNLNRL